MAKLLLLCSTSVLYFLAHPVAGFLLSGGGIHVFCQEYQDISNILSPCALIPLTLPTAKKTLEDA